MSLSFRQLFALLFVTFAGLLAATALQAWTGPTAAAPGGNTPAPLNVGTADQVKNAGLSVNALAAFGDSYFAGNVGIGATNPAQKLVVNGDSWLSGNLIVQSGNVGVGTTNPQGTLDVRGPVVIGTTDYVPGSTGSLIGISTGARTGNTYASIDSWTNGGTAFGNIVLHPTGNGNVGIGTASPTHTLEVAGTAKISGATYLTGVVGQSTGYYACIDSKTGEVSRGGSCSLSDIRLKTNIEPIAPADALDRLSQLTGVSFDWKDPARAAADGRQIGLIAQDVEKQFPEAVITNPDGTKALNYDALLGPMIEAIKELKAQNEELKARVDALEAAH